MSTLTMHWFLPTTGDGRSLVGGGQGVPQQGSVVGSDAAAVGTASQYRPPELDYLATIAKAADDLGFTGVLTPTGTFCEDAWIVTSALIRDTKRLQFLVALRPGLVSPTLAAQMASTFQRLSGGRVALNVVTGGEPAEQKRFGDHLSHDQRYARTDEFLAVVRGAWSGQPVDLAGAHYDVVGARTREAPDPAPPIYFGGSSPAAGPVAARHTDVYLTWGEPPAQVAEKVEWIRGLAEEQGRKIRFGIRLHAIARDTSEDAWRHAQWLLGALDPADVEKAQQAMARSESVGQQRMSALRSGSAAPDDGGTPAARDLEVAPNLWTGVGLVRGGAGTALVGSHEEIADRIEEYADAGISEFIFSGYPHLEEAHWFGEGVLPVLRSRGRLA